MAGSAGRCAARRGVGALLPCCRSRCAAQAQHLCSVDYRQEMAFAGVIGEDWEREQIVAGTAYYVNPDTRLADIAIM